MKNPFPVNLQTSAEVRQQGWQAESRDADGHLISCHAPIEADDQGIAEWIVECTSRGETVTFWPTTDKVATTQPPPPQTHVMGRWLPIAQADKTINHVTEFTEIGLKLMNSDTFWVRDEDGRVYQAAWSEGNNGRDYWWDWEAESAVDPVEFMPHPLDPRFAATEGKDNG